MENQPINILVLTSWSAAEPLITSYVIPNLRIIAGMLPTGSKIILQTQDGNRDQKLSFHASWLEHISLPYHRFGVRAVISQTAHLFLLSRLIRKHRIAVIHAFAPPAGMVGLLLKRITGRTLVVDSWEPHAEAMVESGVWKRGSLSFRLLWAAEKGQAMSADWLIAASRSMQAYAKQKWGVDRNDHVLFRPACVDLNTFDPAKFDKEALRRERGLSGALVCVVVSKIGGLYLSDDLFRFLAVIRHHAGPSFKTLLITPASENEVNALAEKYQLPAGTIVRYAVPHHEIPGLLALADFAFNPQRPVPSKRFGTPVKDGEYWAMGLPLVILPEISEDSEIVRNQEAGVVLEDLSEEAMQRAAAGIISFCRTHPSPVARIRKVAEQYRSYSLAEQAYSQIYSGTSLKDLR